MKQPLVDLIIPGNLKDVKLPHEMTTEEILEEREKADLMIEQLEAAKSVFNSELLDRLNTEKVDGMVVGEKSITKVKRYSFKTPLSYAEEMGAVKTVVDTEKLKSLVLKGIDVPEVNVTEYILVKTIKREDDEPF